MCRPGLQIGTQKIPKCPQPPPPPPGVGRNRRIESSSLEILYAFRSVFSGEIKAKSYCVVLLTLDCFNALTMVSLNCMH